MATKWPGELISGNPIIDFQHRLVLQALKKLTTRLRGGDGSDAFKEALIFFECYCIEHFGDEEMILAEYRYPDLARHKAEHENLTAEIDKIKLRYNEDGYSQKLGFEYMAIISCWLKRHFDREDREIINFLRDKFPVKKEVRELMTE
jgi:hemerythrin